MEHDSLGRTSGKFPGRTKHPQLGTRLLGWGGGGEGREKTGTNRINIGEQSDPSGCLESAYFARQFFFPFSPNAEPGPRLNPVFSPREIRVLFLQSHLSFHFQIFAAVFREMELICTNGKRRIQGRNLTVLNPNLEPTTLPM